MGHVGRPGRARGDRALVAAAADWARVRGLAELRLPADATALALDPPPRRLETERLLLRPFEPGDLAALHALHSHEEVLRWLYEDAGTLESDRIWLAGRIARTRFALTGDGLGFAAVRDGVLVGDLSLTLSSAEHLQGEVGFLVPPEHQGRGYATEAAGALLELGFETFGLHRIVGRLEARNTASARVLEKLGMRREAHLVENELVKGEWQSELVYARLRASHGGGSTPPSRPAG